MYLNSRPHWPEKFPGIKTSGGNVFSVGAVFTVSAQLGVKAGLEQHESSSNGAPRFALRALHSTVAHWTVASRKRFTKLLQVIDLHETLKPMKK